MGEAQAHNANAEKNSKVPVLQKKSTTNMSKVMKVFVFN
jgi:hypothetical protein